MKYYQWPDEYSDIAGGTEYLETDSDGCAFRQIAVNGDQVIASNVLFHGWLQLAEGSADYDEPGDDCVEAITEQEFNAVWNAHLEKRRGIWEQIKRNFPIGKPVEGHIHVFYPQGTIVKLGGEALGVADYAACAASTRPDFMVTQHKITAVVEGYDEVNQWIMLSSPQVHEEKLPPDF